MYTINIPERLNMRTKVLNGAKKYDTKLINKIFWIICDDGSQHNVRFFKKDFQHLTGLLSDLPESEFYKRCCDNTLSLNNILPNQKYNLPTLRYKTNIINNIDDIIYGRSENSLFMINLHTHTIDYPVAIRNSNMNACIGFKDNSHRARTVRKYANSANADKQLKIIAIFSKQQSDKKYTNLVYLSDKTVLFEKISNIKELISEDISL